MKKQISLIVLFLVTISMGWAKDYVVKSPDGKIQIRVKVDQNISYNVMMDGKEVLSPSVIGLKVNGVLLGQEPRVQKVRRAVINEQIKMVVPRKYQSLTNHCNQMTLWLKGKAALVFRVYDEGVAYRWKTTMKGNIQVDNEEVNYNFSEDNKIWFPEEESIYSHQEREYIYTNLSKITPQRFCSTGTLVDLTQGRKVYISESDLRDYPGMFLQGSKKSDYGLQGKFAGYPLELKKTSDRDVKVTRYANYLAKTKGSRDFPWRVMILSRNDADLVQSELIYKLATPLMIEDPSWIKPGKVAWDWWNACNVYGVDFASGENTATYKYFIDFASENNLEYIILDEGWYHLDDVMKVKKAVDLKELFSYAKQKNVGIILWVTWKALEDKLEEAFDVYSKMGAKGFKVDFMQRDDQWMVDYYWRIAKKAADYKMLIDYHGAYKPAGLRRAYPNVITREGLRGMEQSKWGEYANPEHDLILPFTRMVAGPMDYTPGAMKNASKKNFRPVFSEPMSMGTRCHQLAMYVVFESPLQMLSDNPTNYMKEKECMEFLDPVPSVWDDTKVLDAKVSDYILVARKSGEQWFVGAMTDWSKRDLTLNLDFLGEGEYIMEMWKDGVNAKRHASDYKKVVLNVTRKSQVPVHMAPGGGWVAIIHK